MGTAGEQGCYKELLKLSIVGYLVEKDDAGGLGEIE